MATGWKSERDRDDYLALYRDIRAGFAPVERDVETKLGKTHVYAWPGDGVPYVFLHGAGTNTLMWRPVIEAMADQPMVAFDTPGEPGESVPQGAVDDIDALVDWVIDALNAVGVKKCHLVGASYGGWVAMSAALVEPKRFASVTLVEPAFDKIRMAVFMAHGMATGLTLAIPGPQRAVLAKLLHVGPLATDEKMRRLGVMGFRNFDRRSMPKPSPVTDEALGALSVPAHVLLASASTIHHPIALAKRIAKANPSIDVEIVPRAGHTLPYEYPELVAGRIVRAASNPTH